MNTHATLEPIAIDITAAKDDQSGIRVLLRRIANGDRGAFNEMHIRFHGLVYATAIQILGNHEDAEDTSQDVFAQLWAKAKLYNSSRGKPSTWLTTLAKNRAIDRLRSRDRRCRLNQNFEDEMRTVRGWVPSNPARDASTNELAWQTRSAVLQLSSEQQQAIQLAFFDGLTQLEIAKRTGEPLGTVKARIRRGLGKLRSMIKDRR
jgi:RNA polymerase sigma-70 factor (ECF subfamily)